jgi:lysosomal alpha-mannosidase
LWKGMWIIFFWIILGQSSWLFTHVTHNDYRPPPGFCFDILCNDEPFIDSKRSPDYNVDKLVKKKYIYKCLLYYLLLNIFQVKKFIEFATNQSTMYVSENIIELMGEDFHYQNARQWFKNMDKLIK